jgi:hypothetical protein
MLTLTEREMEAINEVREGLHVAAAAVLQVDAQLHVIQTAFRRLSRDMENIWASISERNSLPASPTPTKSSSEDLTG